ncbi:Homeodomain-like protein [Cynara cardunculus var. scolymus]|uniref:Homeodomain-like protein n=1 Tax=Cynara cardunculus var. scolymus TaxID=59895 RepID=A0A124SE43_CYNCS|nr:Homeodomain-like protein [Cynara cardunculus var. scolymus]
MDLLSKNHLNPESEPKSQHEFEFEDDFPMETKGVFQDLHQLDNISLVGSSFEPDYTNHVTGYDPFGPLPFGVGSNDVDLYEFKPLEHVNDGGGMVVSLNHQYKSYMSWGGSDFSTRLGIVECPIQDAKLMSFFVPDEGSCVTADNGIKKGNRKWCKGKKKTNSSKGQWTREEDRDIETTQFLTKKDFWTEEEDRILIAAHAEVGNKWSEIAKKLPGRTENSTKNHWNATKRRQYTRRKCRSKWPRPSPILQNYIKSLNLPRGRMNSNRSNQNHALTTVKPSSSAENQEDFDYNEVPEFAMDEKLLEWDNNIESLLDDVPSINGGGEEVDSYLMASASSSSGLQGEVKKEVDLMEMISQHGIWNDFKRSLASCASPASIEILRQGPLRYQSPNNDPSTIVSVNFDFAKAASSPPSALSGTDAALTSKPSDSRSGTGEGVEIQSLNFLDEDEQQIEGNLRADTPLME